MHIDCALAAIHGPLLSLSCMMLCPEKKVTSKSSVVAKLPRADVKIPAKTVLDVLGIKVVVATCRFEFSEGSCDSTWMECQNGLSTRQI
jgi:hypothetical protein